MSDRVAIVTGASAGIGLSVASRLHKRGWVVVGSSPEARLERMDVRGDGCR